MYLQVSLPLLIESATRSVAWFLVSLSQLLRSAASGQQGLRPPRSRWHKPRALSHVRRATVPTVSPAVLRPHPLLSTWLLLCVSVAKPGAAEPCSSWVTCLFEDTCEELFSSSGQLDNPRAVPSQRSFESSLFPDTVRSLYLLFPGQRLLY